MRLCLALLLAALATPAPAATLRLLAGSAAGTIDPQVNYTQQYWQVFTATHDGLLAFRKLPGDAGRALVPDLADAMPETLPGPPTASTFAPASASATAASSAPPTSSPPSAASSASAAPPPAPTTAP